MPWWIGFLFLGLIVLLIWIAYRAYRFKYCRQEYATAVAAGQIPPWIPSSAFCRFAGHANEENLYANQSGARYDPNVGRPLSDVRDALGFPQTNLVPPLFQSRKPPTIFGSATTI